jgi:hypothetical protein
MFLCAVAGLRAFIVGGGLGFLELCTGFNLGALGGGFFSCWGLMSVLPVFACTKPSMWVLWGIFGSGLQVSKLAIFSPLVIWGCLANGGCAVWEGTNAGRVGIAIPVSSLITS